MTASRLSGLAALVLWLGGCNALVETDTSRLGGGQPDNPDPDPATAECAEPCDDGIACTVDACDAGRCTQTADDGACDEGERCNPGVGCVPRACTEDADCDDRDVCNGSEVCDPQSPEADPQTGCVGGTALECDDGVDCTQDSCDPEAGCQHTADATRCDDGVDCTQDVCDPEAPAGSSGCSQTPRDDFCDFCLSDSTCDPQEGCQGGFLSRPRDCSDDDPCTQDRCLGSAGMCAHDPQDGDGDGYAAERVNGTRCGGEDCDDGDGSVYPGAQEYCNDQDDDCDGQIDEECEDLPESCEHPQEVALDNGALTLRGTFAAFDADHGTRCGESGGTDAVYRVKLDADGPQDVLVDASASEATTVVAVSEGCSNDDFEVACAGRISADKPSGRLFVHGFRGDSFFLLVDATSDAERGAFEVSISTQPAAEDACDAPLDITGGAVVLGTLPQPEVGRGESSSNCFAPTAIQAPEAIFQLQAPPDGSIHAEALSDDFDPLLYARAGSCRGSQAQELDCDEAGSLFPGGSQTSIDANADGGETVWVFVDNGAAGGRYRLEYNP